MFVGVADFDGLRLGFADVEIEGEGVIVKLATPMRSYSSKNVFAGRSELLSLPEQQGVTHCNQQKTLRWYQKANSMHCCFESQIAQAV